MTPATLHPLPLTAEAFAPFGEVVALQRPASGGTPINEGSTLRHELAPPLDLGRANGHGVLALYAATARRLPFTAREVECHRLSEQVFLPFGAPRRCVLLVAPAGPVPATAALRAFVTDGSQGVRLRAGTWHHGLLALDDGPWAVLERRAAAQDCDEATLDMPVLLAL